MSKKLHFVQNESPALFHAKWVGKIALIVAVVAWIALLLAIFLVTDENGADYAHIISSHSLTRQSLGPAILVFGLVMVVVASISTWLIALYSSFRVAGPLFRFSQNLKGIIENAFAVPMAIRNTDMFQREWHQFDASQERLREHYGYLRKELHQFEQSMLESTEYDAASLHQAFSRLQEVERRVQL